jgi:hypothetical protein
MELPGCPFEGLLRWSILSGNPEWSLTGVESYLRRAREYVPFATATLIYLFTGGELGAEVMLEAAFQPWWLSLVALPPLLVLVILGLGILDLGK